MTFSVPPSTWGIRRFGSDRAVQSDASALLEDVLNCPSRVREVPSDAAVSRKKEKARESERSYTPPTRKRSAHTSSLAPEPGIPIEPTQAHWLRSRVSRLSPESALPPEPGIPFEPRKAHCLRSRVSRLSPDSPCGASPDHAQTPQIAQGPAQKRWLRKHTRVQVRARGALPRAWAGKPSAFLEWAAAKRHAAPSSSTAVPPSP